MPSPPKLETLSSKGIRHNGPRSFEVVLTGHELYQLLEMLQRRAVAADNYLDCAEAVYFAERVREEVKRQGF